MLKLTCFALLTLLWISPVGASPVGADSGDDQTTSVSRDAFSGLVDIGQGRQLFSEWRGNNGPTVVLIAGKGGDALSWRQILDPNDPAHSSPTDDITSGVAELHLSDDAVFPSVARFARTLVYDRPGTRFEGPNLSTPVAQPHSVEADVDDLYALLVASGQPQPYVLVCHSYGGYIASLFARRYPETVAGLVMVDAANELMEEVIGPEKFAYWDAGHRRTSDGSEGILVIDASQKIRAAGPMPKVPTVVLSADKWLQLDLLPAEVVSHKNFLTFADWQAGQNLLASRLQAEHITKTNSGHFVYNSAPALVIDAIREIVEKVRTLRPEPEAD